MMDLTEAGADVLHDWIDVCETKAKAHSKRAARYEAFSLSSRTCLVLITGTLSIVALIRTAMVPTVSEFVYSLVFAGVVVLLMLLFGNDSIDKSTFHLRMMHELSFMKMKCSYMLAERRSPEIIKEEYNSIMLRSNKLINFMN